METGLFQTLVLDQLRELKQEIRDTRMELKGDITDLRSEMGSLRTELKGDIADLRSDMKEDRQKLEEVYQARSSVKIKFGWQWSMVSFVIAVFAAGITQIFD